MKTTDISYSVLTVVLRAALVVALVSPGWLVYSKLPHESGIDRPATSPETTLQIVLHLTAGESADALDIPVNLYPIDIVAARHEYFTERRAGKRFDDFVSERMKGRAPVAAKLDKQGQTSVVIGPGSWWLHAQLSGEENLEWRLPLNVAGPKQIVELTSQNVYTRTRSF
ncbi:MAG TPA: hypothetical protein VF899_22895 [Pyrinomonadaceae bacterium]